MYQLNTESKRLIAKTVGLSYDEIIKMNSSEIDNIIEKKNHKKLKHKQKDIFKFSGRGTPFIHLWRFVDLKEIDNLLAKI